MKLTADTILDLFRRLDRELATRELIGELHLAGGAVMCLAHEAREATADVDATFKPAREVREAARRVAEEAGVPPDWLNDAVKGFLASNGEFDPYLELPNLKVFVARPEYLLAMKCVAMRLGPESRDLDDIRYLLRYLNIETVDQALEVIGRYYEDAHLLPKTRLALEELLG